MDSTIYRIHAQTTPSPRSLFSAENAAELGPILAGAILLMIGSLQMLLLVDHP